MTAFKQISCLALAALLALTAAGCGVKSDLVTPDGKQMPRDQKDKDPSRPPSPIGQ
jgi:predicted small lipoprotein YifL